MTVIGCRLTPGEEVTWLWAAGKSGTQFQVLRGPHSQAPGSECFSPKGGTCIHIMSLMPGRSHGLSYLYCTIAFAICTCVHDVQKGQHKGPPLKKPESCLEPQ